MSRVLAHSRRFLSHSPERVFAVLADFETYNAWWPRPGVVTVLDKGAHGLGEVVHRENPNGLWWVFAVTIHEPGRKLRLNYVDGAWRGTTTWLLEPSGEGTQLTYEIDLEVAPGWMGKVGKLMRFDHAPDEQLRDIFDAIDKRCQAG